MWRVSWIMRQADLNHPPFLGFVRPFCTGDFSHRHGLQHEVVTVRDREACEAVDGRTEQAHVNEFGSCWGQEGGLPSHNGSDVGGLWESGPAVPQRACRRPTSP